jgi:hypothetical protein
MSERSTQTVMTEPSAEPLDHGELVQDGNPGRPVITKVSWRPDPDLSFEEWVGQGRKLGLMGRNVGWWIGDWLRFGNAVYGERYVRAARVTGYDVQTLMNMVYVASHIEHSRRREALSWSHHAEVACLSADEQDRWLDRAEQERLSVRCLRQELRREKRALKDLDDRARGQLTQTTDADPDDTPESQVVCPSCGHLLRS